MTTATAPTVRIGRGTDGLFHVIDADSYACPIDRAAGWTVEPLHSAAKTAAEYSEMYCPACASALREAYLSTVR